MRRCWVLPVLTWLVCATPAFAQTNLQLWANVTFDWVKSDRLTYELDLEPKVLLAGPEGEPAWSNLDLTPNVEYSWKRWLDLVGEATVGRTFQTDDVTTFEVTPRVGVRFHVFSRNTTPYLPKVREAVPKRRVVVRDLLRVESRNFFYTGSGANESFSSNVRFRNRTAHSDQQAEPDRRRRPLHPRRLGVFHPAQRARRAVRQQAADPRRVRVSAEPGVAFRGALHVDALPRHAR
jgi:hypothetical protein